MKKSHIAQFILTLLFGPLGLFYSSTAAAIALVIAAIVFGYVTFGFALLVIWPVSILVGFATVARHNGKVAIESRRHEELLQAVKSGKPVL